MFTLSKNELEIMCVLWEVDRALPRSEIIQLSPNRTWKESSIHILLNSLLKKGAIKVDGYVQCVKHYGRTYRAALTASEYSVMQLEKSFPDCQTKKMNTKKLLFTILNTTNMDMETLDELSKIVQERLRELSAS